MIITHTPTHTHPHTHTHRHRCINQHCISCHTHVHAALLHARLRIHDAKALAHPAHCSTGARQSSGGANVAAASPRAPPAPNRPPLSLPQSTPRTGALGKLRRHCCCSPVPSSCSCHSLSCAFVACFWQRRPWPEQNVKQRRRCAGCYSSRSASCSCCGLIIKPEG